MERVLATQSLGPALEVGRFLESSFCAIVKGPTQVHAVAPFFARQIAQLKPEQIAMRLTLFARAGLFRPDDHPQVRVLPWSDSPIQGKHEATLYVLERVGAPPVYFSISGTRVQLEQ